MIVDASVATELVNQTPDAIPVLKWLLRGRGALIVGGLVTDELYKTGFRSTLVTLDRAGRLRRQDDAKVNQLTAKIREEKQCRSNDPHIIAAAMVSGCRLIYSKDKKLCKDAKNKKLLTPTASIYQTRKHCRLLTECDCK